MKFGKEKKTVSSKINTSFRKIQKNQQKGINLSALSQAQKKMCVKLLAQGNVQFLEKDDSYVATLRVPTQQLQQFNHKNNTPLKQHKNATPLKQHKNRNQTKDKCLKTNKQVTDKKDQQKHTLHKKQPGYHDGKKPLSKTVKLSNIKKLEQLYPQIDIYIYPKRMGLNTLVQLIENIYQEYWNLHQDDSSTKSVSHRSSLNTKPQKTINNGPSFQKVFLMMLESTQQIYFKGSRSQKIDQYLVNVLDTIYHYQFKNSGIKLFLEILTEAIQSQALNYFLILRALLEGIIGQPILDYRNIYKVGPLKLDKDNQSQHTGYFNVKNNVAKIKWSPYDTDIEQNQVKQFLRACLINQDQFAKVFQKLTHIMYFDQKKRNNYISYFDLVYFLIEDFNSKQFTQNTNLELSYSQQTTLHDILFTQTQRENIQPLQTYFVQKIEPISPLKAEEHFQRNSDFMQEINLVFEQKCKEIANRLYITEDIFKVRIMPKIQKCLQATITLNKIIWVEAIGIDGTEAELLYIENLQKDFQKYRQQINSANMINEFIKRILFGPGVMNIFLQSVEI